jgi:hypothetical protein
MRQVQKMRKVDVDAKNDYGCTMDLITSRVLIAAIISMGVGIGGTVAYSHFFGADQAITENRAQLLNLEASLQAEKKTTEQLRSEKSAAEQQLEKLRAELDQQLAKAVEIKNTPPNPPPEKSQFLNNIVKGQLAHLNDNKLLALKSRLHMSPEQEAQIKEILAQEAERNEVMTKRILAGEKVDVKALASQMPKVKGLEEQLGTILSPDQKTEYEVMKKEEKVKQIETMATFELNQISPVLGLNKDQEDQFFQAITGVEQELNTPEGKKKYELEGESDNKNPNAYLELRQRAKLDAVSKVLTPPQLEIYRKQLDSQTQMHREMMKKFAPPQ